MIGREDMYLAHSEHRNKLNINPAAGVFPDRVLAGAVHPQQYLPAQQLQEYCPMADKRLLIVHDLPGLGEVVGRVARNMGYDVRITTHAEEFKRDIDSFDPTTVVLDIVMPDNYGIDLSTG